MIERLTNFEWSGGRNNRGNDWISYWSLCLALLAAAVVSWWALNKYWVYTESGRWQAPEYRFIPLFSGGTTILVVFPVIGFGTAGALALVRRVRQGCKNLCSRALAHGDE